MWLFYIAVPLIVLAIIAAIAGGGIFTLILVPLAVIAVIAGFWSAISARASGAPGATGRAHENEAQTAAALPHELPRSPSRVPGSPEALTDARREAQ